MTGRGMIALAVILSAAASLPAEAKSRHKHRHTQSHAQNHTQSGGQHGIASIYAYGGKHNRTASGQRLNSHALTAAHRTLPFGTAVRVLNKRNGRSVVVTINDRGPFVRGRVIDVTPAAARALGFSGLTQVSLAVVN